MDSQTGVLKPQIFRTILICIALLVPSVFEAQEFEYKLKAEFIERFTRFIDWPASALPNHSSFEICIAGTNPFGGYLNQITSELKIKGRKGQVKEIGTSAVPPSCNVLFVSNTAGQNLGRILESVAEKPVLTISDTEGFAEKGVLINFYRSDSYIRFEINVAAAHRTGLKFSSRLLKLARLVDSPDPANHGVNRP